MAGKICDEKNLAKKNSGAQKIKARKNLSARNLWYKNKLAVNNFGVKNFGIKKLAGNKKGMKGNTKGWHGKNWRVIILAHKKISQEKNYGGKKILVYKFFLCSKKNLILRLQN